MKTKLISMLLAVCMVFTIMPVGAFASETGITTKISNVLDGGEPAICENHIAHDEICGYIEAVAGIPATEEIPVVEGKPCTHECEVCVPAEEDILLPTTLLNSTRAADVSNVDYEFVADTGTMGTDLSLSGTTGTAANNWDGGWFTLGDGIGFNFGADGHLKVSMPDSGNYTYGTTSADGATVVQTASNQATLPASGWNWSIYNNNDAYTLTLNNAKMDCMGNFDALMFFRTNLTLLLLGSNSITTAGGSAVSGGDSLDLTIDGNGSLSAIGVVRGISLVGSSLANLEIKGGTITMEAGRGSNIASAGISVSNNVTISGGNVTIKNLATTGDKFSCGIHLGDNMTITGSETVVHVESEMYGIGGSASVSLNGAKEVKVSGTKSAFERQPRVTNMRLTSGEWNETNCTYQFDSAILTATAGTGGSISPSGNVTVNKGENKTFIITPNSNYSIADVKVDDVSQGRIQSYTFENVSANHTIEAAFSYNGSSGGGSSSGGGGSSNSSNITITSPSADKPKDPTQGKIKLNGKVDSNGKVSVDITHKMINDVYNKAFADAKKKGNEANGIILVLNVKTGNQTANSLTVNLPKSAQDAIINNKIVNTVVVVNSPDIKIGMDLSTIKEINKQADADVHITATKVGNNKLNDQVKAAIGNRPLFDLKVSYGRDKHVEEFGKGQVAVSIPYTLADSEKADNVKAVYVNADGELKWLENSVYNSDEKAILFYTNHFSIYGVGYKEKEEPKVEVPTETAEFTDIENHWAKESIGFVVGRGLFSGTSDTTFSPNIAMTRGMFVTVLGRLAEADVSKYTKSSFSDVTADAYYMGYVEWATKNGIAKGIGDGKFAPEQKITREQMAVIIANYAKVMRINLPKVQGENTFADNPKISTYAQEAVNAMQMAGAISGKEGNEFDPQGTATRAEVSAVVMRFVKLMINSAADQG
ncbi:S-layer homology domain-containing protein [Anaerotignum sp.]|uniref:S-layer homology domain-containing protein n=1 Tax=Anaerotignum sp. TaxID=2039241 RepID=UPI0028AE5413|nr:S-layer homology domain-containing protein [Anaerotignum sp.]